MNGANQGDKPKNILIAGARSKIAEAIARILKSETSWKITLLSSGIASEEHSERVSLYPIDYSNTKPIKDILLREMPDAVVNTAALTDVDECEINREKAWQANARWTEFLLRMCKITDARFIQFSTDYIFDGLRGPYLESDAPNPINYYGKTKLASENLCRVSNLSCAIIRTNVVYGASSCKHRDFVQWTLSKLREGKAFNVVDDQFSNPTYADDLGLAVYRIILKRREGVYNVGGGEWINRFEFAKKIATAFQFDGELIHPCATESLRQAARRPLRGGLVTLKSETDLGVKPANINAGLTSLRRQLQYLEDIAGNI